MIPAALWTKLPKSARAVLQATHAKAHSRGLCSRCYSHHHGAGTLDCFDPIRRPTVEVLEEYEILSRRGEGFTDAQIADRLGMHIETLRRHLEKRTT